MATPKEIVTKFFEAFGKLDTQGMRAALADDVDWVVLGGDKNIPFAGAFHGADTIIGVVTSNAGSTEGVQVAPKWVVAEDDKVVILMHEDAKVARLGRAYSVDSIHVYTVKEGKIVRFDNYFNPLPILEATFGDVAYVPPVATLPQLLKEEWIFWEGDKYHHYETFTYEYDAQGLKIRGALNNFGRNVAYLITYHYDANGQGNGEDWVNSADPQDTFALTYRYNDARQIVGGKGVGRIIWEINYEYDDKGRKVKMTNTYSNGMAWEFAYSYDVKTGKCVYGQGKSTSGLRCTIAYTYANE